MISVYPASDSRRNFSWVYKMFELIFHAIINNAHTYVPWFIDGVWLNNGKYPRWIILPRSIISTKLSERRQVLFPNEAHCIQSLAWDPCKYSLYISVPTIVPHPHWSVEADTHTEGTRSAEDLRSSTDGHIPAALMGSSATSSSC